ncbi:6-phosphogluconolactonase [uncultured Nevskia sp.]|uniref:6-phosphogluconolactonase n=1 Tax=uncultured Nevskia sp. TaxID=228950 RepID=UPI0025D3892F|nr:6-phosphogluconolactonase [uncultured Nevskia sp.]
MTPIVNSENIENRIEHQFDDAQTASETLAALVATQLADALLERGVASLVVSGGKSPIPFFAALRVLPLDWSRVWITLADERWVEPSSADSNERLLREHLLRDAAAAARFVPLKSAFEIADAGLAASSAALAAIPRPFDVVVLGMGEDGHTASLFPGASGLPASLLMDDPTPLAAITPLTAPHQRISLRLPALLDSRCIHLPLSGASKLAVYQRALAENDPLQWPIAAVLHQAKVPVNIWLS